MNKNILLDRLPQYTENGLRIRTDFRESIKFELLMQDSKIKKEDKIAYALNLYYYEPNKIKNIQEAIQEIVWFYGGGKKDKEIKINDKEQVQEKTKQIYSYEFDDEYIYSAFMEQYGIDLNKLAKNGLIDPVIGRDKEVMRVLEILGRKNKNNPILVGEAGVGKTAIVENIASMIESGKLSNLSGKRIINLNMSSMVAGTKYRGEFEEKMQKLINELENSNDIILFIDEMQLMLLIF